jgi:chromate transporter
METIKHPSFKETFQFWLLFGFISFGGPTGQIAIMFTELVEKRKWISESRFLHALNFCMLLPGPEAIQLAIYIGWLLHGTLGGLVAGIFFLLPSVFIMVTLSYIYVHFGSIPFIASIFFGLKPAVIAIVFFAAIRMGTKVLKNNILRMIAIASFISIFFLNLPFPLIVFVSALCGLVGGYYWKEQFNVLNAAPGSTSQGQSVIHDELPSPDYAQPSVKNAIKTSFIYLTIWWLPLVLVGFWRGWESVLFQEGIFFSKAAMVTIGGAYSVLTYVAQQSVEYFHWLAPGQMIDGLGLAETTPGPLIMVLQFVGFLGAWNNPEELSPLSSAILGAFITSWATFVPCFYWIFLGAPYIEKFRGNERMVTMLTTITSAVVGVIFNLAVWFSLHVLFPAQGGFAVFPFILSVIGFIGLWRWKWDV